MKVVGRVVNVSYTPYTLYIGRGGMIGPDGVLLHRSIWANPFKIGTHGDRETVILKYMEWIRKPDQYDLFGGIDLLDGQVLGCWCRPREGFQGRLLCHGQVLLGLLYGVDPREID